MTTTTDLEDNVARVDAHTIAVAALLPFPVELEADMGGTFALHIELGVRGTDPGDPADTAGVDPDLDNGPLDWWLDIDGGCETICSGLTIDTDPTIVAAWITEQARLHDCPAAR